MPKQKLKRLNKRTFRRFSKIFYLMGFLLCFHIVIFFIKTKLSQKNMTQRKVQHTFFEPQCRQSEFDEENFYFKPLCGGLRFDEPSEQYYITFQFNIPEVKAERKDWHDYAAMAKDANRNGPGEHGEPTFNTDASKVDLEKKFFIENNFNGFISNIISVNRSVPDIRPKECLTKRYLAKLPTVSIVIPCRNEFHSGEYRGFNCKANIVNRTPKELLKEIIIVDDHSSRGYNINEMILYTDRYFPSLVKFIRLPKRMGLMYVRTAGAKTATSDVLVFLDSHIECNYNWLPPLLEPIAINDRITTTPFIDRIDEPTFQYEWAYGGLRGGPNWNLVYTIRYFHTGPDIDETIPYKDAVMMGGLFAISRRFFWELGGYDVNLDTYGSEQFELSFKIWMCGGMLLAVPCSHVGHIFVVPFDNKKSPKDVHFVERNKKRVAEVWMDKYKHYLYAVNAETYYELDAGDLTEQHALRARLQCKSFEWYLNFVAPDFRQEHPLDLPPDFANGTIESLAFPNYCLDNMGGISFVGVYVCDSNRKRPYLNQHWNFNVYQEIKNFYENKCLDVYLPLPNANVSLYPCHRQGGNQFWYYDYNRKWLVHGGNETKCLEVIQVDTGFQVVVNICDEMNKKMQWIFAYVNELLTPGALFNKTN